MELKAIFDTGTSITLIPAQFYEDVMVKLQEKVKDFAHIWLQEDNIFVTRNCSDWR